jgi:hypothetical protein
LLLVTHDHDLASLARRTIRLAVGAIVGDTAARPEHAGADGNGWAELPPSRRSG